MVPTINVLVTGYVGVVTLDDAVLAVLVAGLMM